MRKTDLPAIIVAVAWVYLLMSGIDGLLGIRSRHVLGYPAIGQIVLYAVIPAAFVVLLAGSAFLSRKAGWFYDLYPVVTVLTAFLLLPILFVWGGGV